MRAEPRNSTAKWLRRVGPSLWGYQRSWLPGDALAATMLLVIAVPEQLATARLAGMPPVTGLFAFLAGTTVFAILGSSPLLSVGADSTIAPLFALGVANLAPTGTQHYTQLVGILAVTTGVIVGLIGVARLGWIAEFLSTPIITGFLAGVAVIIVAHQLPDLLGLPAVGGSALHRVVESASHLRETNGWSAGVGVTVLVIVIAAAKIDRRIPGALFGLVGSAVAVGVLGLHSHGVAVLGSIAHGVPHLGLVGLSFATLRKVLPGAAVIALIIVSQTAATSRAFAADEPSPSEVDRNFVGVGAGSIVAGLLGAFPVDASPPRTGAAEAAGGRSQLAGLLAALGVLILIPFAGVLHDVPLATLAAVLIYIAGRIFRVHELVAIGRFDLVELALALVTLLTVALVGVEQGIIVSVGLAILDRTRLSARPQLRVLGQLPGTTSWVLTARDQTTVELPGVLAVGFATPLWYANATRFRAEIETAIRATTTHPTLLVLDVDGMSDIDFTGVETLAKLLASLDAQGIRVAIARAGDRVRDNLARAGLSHRITGGFHPSVDAAVTERH